MKKILALISDSLGSSNDSEDLGYLGDSELELPVAGYVKFSDVDTLAGSDEGSNYDGLLNTCLARQGRVLGDESDESDDEIMSLQEIEESVGQRVRRIVSDAMLIPEFIFRPSVILFRIFVNNVGESIRALFRQI
jgi:hypothetical protein